MEESKQGDSQAIHQASKVLRFDQILRGLEVAGIFLVAAALLVAVLQQCTAIEQTRIAADALRHQRIASAWQILSIGGAGSTGKQYALTSLLELEGQISHVDLSCAAIGQRAGVNCTRPPNLTDLILSPEGDYNFTITNSKFDQADLSGASLRRTILSGVSLIGADLRGIELTNSSLNEVDARGADFYALGIHRSSLSGVDFSNANIVILSVDDSVIVQESLQYESGFHDINVSGANFCPANDDFPICQDIVSLPDEFWKGIWFFENNPPKGMGGLNPETFLRKACPAPEGQILEPVFAVPDDCPEQYVAASAYQ